MPTRTAATALFASALFLLAACRGTVPIRDLLDDPGRSARHARRRVVTER